MGFMDFLTGDNAGKLGNWIGTAGDAMNLGSALAKDEKTADGLGMGSGILSLLSSGLGLTSGIAKLGKEGEDKTEAGLDIAESSLGLIGGAADTIGGALGLAGKDGGKNIASMVSGGAGILGGLLGGGRAIAKIVRMNKLGKKAESEMTEDEKKELKEYNGAGKWQTYGNLFGGATKIFGGITSIGQGAKPDSKGWKLAGQLSAGGGALTGLFGSIAGMFGGNKPATGATA